MEKTGKIQWINLIVIGFYLVFVAVRRLFGIPCVFDYLFGIPCPGCGMTRALNAAFHLEFAQAFQNHAMFWSIPLIAYVLLVPGKALHTLWGRIIVAILGVGFLANWIYHLVN